MISITLSCQIAGTFWMSEVVWIKIEVPSTIQDYLNPFDTPNKGWYLERIITGAKINIAGQRHDYMFWANVRDTYSGPTSEVNVPGQRQK